MLLENLQLWLFEMVEDDRQPEIPPRMWIDDILRWCPMKKKKKNRNKNKKNKKKTRWTTIMYY